jgi:hypothetical protein
MTSNLILRSRAQRGVSIAQSNLRAVMGDNDSVSHLSAGLPRVVETALRASSG